MTHSTLGASLTPHREPRSDSRRWAALTLLCLAQFMLILDVTVVNVALPDIGADLHLGRSALTWVVTSYTLAFGGLMLFGGRLADALGARRTFVAGLALFTGASLAAGLAGGPGTLLTARVAQGVGAALLSPAALSLVTSTFEEEAERRRALGVWAGIGGAGSAVGVLLGGLLTSGPGWNWIFYVNVPVGLLVLALLPSLVAARRPRPARLDLPGAVLVTGGTAALIKGLVTAGDQGWTAPETLGPLGLAVALYAAFAVTERTVSAPLIDVRVLSRRPVVAGAFLILVATGLLIGMFFLSSVHLQRDRGYSALATGLAFLPVAVATAAGAHIAGRLLGTLGARPVAAAAMAVTAAGLVVPARMNAGTGVWSTLVPALCVAAFGVGAVFVTAFTTALALVPADVSGLASGALNTFHEVGGSIGVAVVSTVAASGVERGVAGSFAHAYAVCAGTAAAAALIALVLVPRGRPRPAGGMHGH
ncbi:MFS transporter [Actinacidiphila acidipaludis]|uniref:MFS transporter n=1 Tax=Actinacidiphila acidipaludis TaxID=2873382 RepID=A0ABS7QCA2_9ACTN|nr:MFS transporter [Streptomyces acidipaludis]MBY8879419.1 MFS transporter [Streptomyces acidipaludis]